jgi:hypothetical protein
VIREFKEGDIPLVEAIHKQNDLPANCLPNLMIVDKDGKTVPNPLFITKQVFENDGKPVMMAFLKVTAEVFVFVDHTVGTPEERWAWMLEFNEHIKQQAWKHGLEQITAFVPPEIEQSFAKRLEDMGYIRSPWQSYTLNLENL